MRTWANGLVVGVVVATLILAIVPRDLVPAVLGFALAVAGAIGWTRQSYGPARHPSVRPLPIVSCPSRDHEEAIYVFGRTVAGTRRAMAEAGRLADGRPSRLVVIVIEPTAAFVPVDSATVVALRQFAESITPSVTVMPCVCRRPVDVAALLPTASTVVVEREEPSWWPTFNRRLANALRRAGCRVALA
jgi:hypothetical protein